MAAEITARHMQSCKITEDFSKKSKVFCENWREKLNLSLTTNVISNKLNIFFFNLTYLNLFQHDMQYVEILNS